MAKCIKCGKVAILHNKICPTCMDNWVKMRKLIFDKLTTIYGRLNDDNLKFFRSELKRLDEIWNNDKDQLIIELSKL